MCSVLHTQRFASHSGIPIRRALRPSAERPADAETGERAHDRPGRNEGPEPGHSGSTTAELGPQGQIPRSRSDEAKDHRPLHGPAAKSIRYAFFRGRKTRCRSCVIRHAESSLGERGGRPRRTLVRERPSRSIGLDYARAAASHYLMWDNQLRRPFIDDNEEGNACSS